MKFRGAVRVLLLIAVLLGLFQNCGRMGFIAEKGSVAGLSSLGVTACEGLLKTTYSKTYFPILSVACNRCHSNAHGSTDLETSFTGFMAKGVNLINYKATHPHGDNGLDLTNQIASLTPQWESGQADYASCVASASAGDAQMGFKFKLNSKTIANLDATKADQKNWKPVEWDLDKEGPSDVTTQFGAYFKMEARYFLQQGNVVGIEFRNPSMRLKATGQNIKVTGLSFYLDKELQSNITTYSDVVALIVDIKDTLLAPGAANALAYYPSANANTEVAVEISNIKFTDETPAPPTTMPPPPTSTPVTFAQLVSGDATLGVFKKNCTSCHSGATPPKGLDLTNYDMAKAAANTILMRINNSAMPMPPSGLVPQTERDVVSRWVSGGTPQ